MRTSGPFSREFHPHNDSFPLFSPPAATPTSFLLTPCHAHGLLILFPVCLFPLEFRPESVFTEWAHNRKFINTQTGTLQRHSRQPGDVSHSHQSGSRKEIQLQPFGSTARLPGQVLERSRNIKDLIGKNRSQEVLLPTSSHWPFFSFLETCHVSATTLSASPYGCCYSSLSINEDTGDLYSKRKVQI